MRKYYFRKFIKNYHQEKLDAYLFILWSAYKNLHRDGRISDRIKEELRNFDLTDMEKEKKREKGERILSRITSAQHKFSFNEYPTIKYIQINNFRGFGSFFEDDKGSYIPLDKKKNIFFGPNGSGKTSFCEAFEYRLTSNIKEAKRRNVKIKDYIRRSETKPDVVIKFNNSDYTAKEFTSMDKEFFQNCFVEKNRLQEFALLGSKDTGVKEQDVIANLLGLEELDNLVSSFVKPGSFNLEPLLKNDYQNELDELLEKNKEYTTLKKHYKKEIIAWEKELEDKHQVMIADINDVIESKVVETEKINNQLENLQNKKVKEQDYQSIKERFYIIEQELVEYKSYKKRLVEEALKLDYESFYKSLQKVAENNQIDVCPACETPVNDVIVHPKNKAERELKQLEEITKLKETKEDLERKMIEQHFEYIKNIADDYLHNSSNFETLKQDSIDNAIQELKDLNSTNTPVEYIERFISDIKPLKEVKTYFKKLEKIREDVEHKNLITHRLKKEVEIKNDEIVELRKNCNQLNDFKIKLKDMNDSLQVFERQRKEIEKNRKKEEQYNSFLKKVENEYTNFYKDMTHFKLNLEREKIQDIEEKVLKYYNQINAHDNSSEIVSNIQFKEYNENYRIFVEVNNHEMDAYSCLSEGHIRALGLSLMLAVAENNNVPFLIFDDVVNAIDSDHRANIIDMMFNDGFLQKTQLIITTHDRLFWERFCNYYSNIIDRKNVDNISYIFNYTNYGTVLAQYNVSFESKIREALKKFDIRQALIYCRIWFESLATKYCVKNQAVLTGRFSHEYKGNLLKPSLESIYSVLNEKFSSNENLKVIKSDLINWNAQNQEHHSFDEHSFNFVHSKNSDEVSKIYDAIKKFRNDMSPKESIEKLSENLMHYEYKITNANKKLEDQSFLMNAPTEIIKKVNASLEENKMLEEEATKEVNRLSKLVVAPT